MTKHLNPLLIFAVLLAGCAGKEYRFDAEGVFEADEVIVSAETSGKILSLSLDEGSLLKKDSAIAIIDSIPLLLQRSQLTATIGSLKDKTLDVEPQVIYLQHQIEAQTIQLSDLEREKVRTERLIEANAAPQKQLDDYNTQIDVLKKQIESTRQQIKVQQTSVGTQNRTVFSELKPLKQSVALVDDQLRRSVVLNPIDGTVLTKYAMTGEMTAAGKALYKIADLSTITLRVYLSGTQLSGLAIGQGIRVFVDKGPSDYREYRGTITTIASKAEFTPKTIQTKEERANLVYAVKIHVKNDGLLKIGMYGEIIFDKTKT